MDKVKAGTVTSDPSAKTLDFHLELITSVDEANKYISFQATHGVWDRLSAEALNAVVHARLSEEDSRLGLTALAEIYERKAGQLRKLNKDPEINDDH